MFTPKLQERELNIEKQIYQGKESGPEISVISSMLINKAHTSSLTLPNNSIGLDPKTTAPITQTATCCVSDVVSGILLNTAFLAHRDS